MSAIDVLQNKPRVLGINSSGRIGKLTLWRHVARKYFQEIVANTGSEVGNGMSAIAQIIEKDAIYGSIHWFLYGIKSMRIIEIVDEKKASCSLTAFR